MTPPPPPSKNPKNSLDTHVGSVECTPSQSHDTTAVPQMTWFTSQVTVKDWPASRVTLVASEFATVTVHCSEKVNLFYYIANMLENMYPGQRFNLYTFWLLQIAKLENLHEVWLKIDFTYKCGVLLFCLATMQITQRATAKKCEIT